MAITEEYDEWVVNDIGLVQPEEDDYENKTIITPSLLTFAFELQEYVRRGYVIDPDKLPTMFGYCYECGMIYSKLTRKEVLEKARAAKKTNTKEESK